MRTYEIKHEPSKLQDGTIKNGNYNIYYYDENGNIENIEFHSVDGINGEVKKGYTLKNN